MLIKIKDSSLINQKIKNYLIEYPTKEVNAIVTGTSNCNVCNFCSLYKGKMDESLAFKHFYRLYCGITVIEAPKLPHLVQTTSDYRTLAKKLRERDKHPEILNYTLPDIIRTHPKNKNVFVLSVIVVKLLKECLVDKTQMGDFTASEEMSNFLSNWQRKTPLIVPNFQVG